MKRWAILTTTLYAIALVLLTVPVTFAAFADWGKNPSDTTIGNTMGIFTAWGYWLWLAVLVTGQILLLLVPIDLSEKRLPARRKLKIPIIVSGFFLANLFIAGVFSILCAIIKDNAFGIFSFTDWVLGHRVAGQPGTVNTTDGGVWTSIFLIIGIFWIIWGLIFSRFAKADDADSLLKRAMRWLLRGSILELIVAVPSHVIVRRRDDCCAPAGTFWGIATGISVMLLCFGPGVFYLFVERCNRLKSKSIKEAIPKSSIN
ncbi:MAG TPA: hypothetical protein VFV23_08225 [Verrucomicrobiae bacterium]|nr:hypothetical protein [Verrucomicrobiae bacterium]